MALLAWKFDAFHPQRHSQMIGRPLDLPSERHTLVTLKRCYGVRGCMLRWAHCPLRWWIVTYWWLMHGRWYCCFRSLWLHWDPYVFSLDFFGCFVDVVTISVFILGTFCTLHFVTYCFDTFLYSRMFDLAFVVFVCWCQIFLVLYSCCVRGPYQAGLQKMEVYEESGVFCSLACLFCFFALRSFIGRELSYSAGQMLDRSALSLQYSGGLPQGTCK